MAHIADTALEFRRLIAAAAASHGARMDAAAAHAALDHLLAAMAQPGPMDDDDRAALASLTAPPVADLPALTEPHAQASYVSVFNMLVREQWEGRFNDFLAWALARAPSVSLWLMHRAGMDQASRILDVNAREGGAGGTPDIVIRAVDAAGQRCVLALELKIGAYLTRRQLEEYQTWRDALGVTATGYLVCASRSRTDLHADHFVAVQDLFDRLRQTGVSVPLTHLLDDALAWFFDPEVSGADVVHALSQESVPYWPVGCLLTSLQARVNELGGDTVWAGNIGSNRSGNRAYRGFKISGANDWGVVAWVGFYIWAGEGYFYVDLAADILDADRAHELGVVRGSQVRQRPLYWAPGRVASGPWTAGQLACDGLDHIVGALVAAVSAG